VDHIVKFSVDPNGCLIIADLQIRIRIVEMRCVLQFNERMQDF